MRKNLSVLGIIIVTAAISSAGTYAVMNRHSTVQTAQKQDTENSGSDKAKTQDSRDFKNSSTPASGTSWREVTSAYLDKIRTNNAPMKRYDEPYERNTKLGESDAAQLILDIIDEPGSEVLVEKIVREANFASDEIGNLANVALSHSNPAAAIAILDSAKGEQTIIPHQSVEEEFKAVAKEALKLVNWEDPNGAIILILLHKFNLSPELRLEIATDYADNAPKDDPVLPYMASEIEPLEFMGDIPADDREHLNDMAGNFFNAVAHNYKGPEKEKKFAILSALEISEIDSYNVLMLFEDLLEKKDYTVIADVLDASSDHEKSEITKEYADELPQIYMTVAEIYADRGSCDVHSFINRHLSSDQKIEIYKKRKDLEKISGCSVDSLPPNNPDVIQ